MSGSVVDIALPHLGHCLRVEHAPDVVAALTQAMPGWPIAQHSASGTTADTYIYRDTEGLWQGSMSQPNEFSLPSAASAACSLVGELIAQRLTAAPELLGLHCGSVEVNGKLVVFPESSKAGKSTLSVAFAAAGYRVFGDDVLGLNKQGDGVAMGIAPRLRLPLSDSFSAEFVEYVERHAGPEDERYRFVIPAAKRLADCDETCSIGSIVLLERDSQITEPQVVTLSPGEGLLQLLCQNFAHRETPDEVLFARLLPLVQRVSCVLLRYSEPLAGARYLAQTIGDTALQESSSASLLNYAPAHTDTIISLSVLDQVWLPSVHISTYPVGDELFLIHTSSGAIHKLNASGKIAWQLLQQEPLSGHTLSDVVATYFDVALDPVTTDIADLLTALAQAQLVTAQTCGGVDV